jgi:hypothetical protein
LVLPNPLMKSDRVKTLVLPPFALSVTQGVARTRSYGEQGVSYERADLGSLPYLVGELHHRQEEVGEQAE